MAKRFDIHEWQANQIKKRLAEQDDFQKRQDRMTPGKNPDAFYKDFDKVKAAANKGFKGDSPMPFRDNPDANDEWSKKRLTPSPIITKVKLKMSNIEDEVTITEIPGSNLRDVKISWGNESHTVDFEGEDTIDDHGNEGLDLETIADSDDGKWQFILDVYAEATYPMTGDFADWDWEELIIQPHPDLDDDDDDLRLEPELDEQNTLAGAGSGNSVTTGDGMGYMSPNAFKKKKKK